MKMMNWLTPRQLFSLGSALRAASKKFYFSKIMYTPYRILYTIFTPEGELKLGAAYFQL